MRFYGNDARQAGKTVERVQTYCEMGASKDLNQEITPVTEPGS